MTDYSGTEYDAGIAAGFDAYPDERLSKADLALEAEWWAGFKARTDQGIEGIDPHDWPDAARGPLMEALRRAEAEVACQGCGQRGHENACDHGKNICPGCWPDKCWSCSADASDAEEDW